MQYYSTNKRIDPVSFKEAVFQGLPADNGLFMPEEIPSFPQDFLDRLPQMDFKDMAYQAAKLFIQEEIEDAELKAIIEEAFNFDVELRQLDDNKYVLELFHGPTLAFKDFGARFMARTMGHFLKSDGREINILVATSGDTGSAVAQGFYGVEGVRVILLYPRGKVSKIQEMQLTTIGGNVVALEVDGTFDDCQALVKQAFLDNSLKEKLNLSSANSINIARLLPQSFYYIFAYSRLAHIRKPIVVCVPSGNYGNLCGGLLAKKMGVPFHRFIAASNANDIVPQYLTTQHFVAKPSIQTISNAMDVGNPSNFVRLTEIYGNDYQRVVQDIEGISFTDEQTKALIEYVYKATKYKMCPHTAIGYGGLQHFMKDEEVGVFLSTAHPSKFKDVVDELIPEPIEIPSRLQEILNRKKQAISISKLYEDFREFLAGSL